MRRCFHEQEWSWFDDPGENHQDFVALASYVGPIIHISSQISWFDNDLHELGYLSTSGVLIKYFVHGF